MVCHTNKRRNLAAGVTLIELLVALSLVGIVLAAAGTMLLQSYANEAAYREQNQAQQNARAAADILSDDLRGAKSGSVPAPTGTAGKTTLSATAFSFIVFNNSGSGGADGETQISYKLENRNLSRQVGSGGSWVVVARDIKVPTPNPNSIPDPSVTVSGSTADVDITSNVGTTPSSTVRVRAKVTMRNYLF